MRRSGFSVALRFLRLEILRHTLEMLHSQRSAGSVGESGCSTNLHLPQRPPFCKLYSDALVCFALECSSMQSNKLAAKRNFDVQFINQQFLSCGKSIGEILKTETLRADVLVDVCFTKHVATWLRNMVQPMCARF